MHDSLHTRRIEYIYSCRIMFQDEEMALLACNHMQVCLSLSNTEFKIFVTLLKTSSLVKYGRIAQNVFLFDYTHCQVSL